MAGQLLSQVVVSIVGTQGLNEDDPLVTLEKVDHLLLEFALAFLVLLIEAISKTHSACSNR